MDVGDGAVSQVLELGGGAPVGRADLVRGDGHLPRPAPCPVDHPLVPAVRQRRDVGPAPVGQPPVEHQLQVLRGDGEAVLLLGLAHGRVQVGGAGANVVDVAGRAQGDPGRGGGAGVREQPPRYEPYRYQLTDEGLKNDALETMLKAITLERANRKAVRKQP